MKGKNFKINIDKLTLCYIASNEIVSDLEDTIEREEDGFRIERLNVRGATNETFLGVSVIDPTKNNGYKAFARIKIGNKFESKSESNRYLWITLENNVFYGYSKYCNELSYIYYIADTLNLKFNNVTEIHIALNSNINWFIKVKKAIRNMKLTPIILNKKYLSEKEIIDKVKYIHTGDRMKYRTNTLVIKNADKDMEICLYNKTDEINESGKKYIKKDFGKDTNIYRNEVRIKRSALKDYLQCRGISWEDFYSKILDFNFLFDVFCYYQQKIIRFVNKERKQITLLDL